MTLGGYWPPSSKVEIADFGGGFVTFFHCNFFSIRGTKPFFHFQAGKFSSAAPSDVEDYGLDKLTPAMTMFAYVQGKMRVAGAIHL